MKLLLFLFFFLLANPAASLAASRDALGLFFNTLVPTLLPFLILSTFCIRADYIRPLTAFLVPFCRKILHLSPQGFYAIVTGFLCGFPVGAKAIADLLSNEQISHEEAEYLLSFCNNASPAFVMTFLVLEHLQDKTLLAPMLFSVYGSALLFGLIRWISFRRSAQSGTGIYAERTKKVSTVQVNFELIDTCILDSVTTLFKLGGYILLFALIAKCITSIAFLPASVKAILIGITEITNGIPALCGIFHGRVLCILLGMTASFGGLSAYAQTVSIIKPIGLSAGHYLFSRIVIACFTGIFLYLLL